MSYNSDMVPPRVFTTVTAGAVHGQSDFITYLANQEDERRGTNNLPRMTQQERTEFVRQALRSLVIQQNPMAAIELRSPAPKKLLLEQE